MRQHALGKLDWLEEARSDKKLKEGGDEKVDKTKPRKKKKEEEPRPEEAENKDETK
jgi:hypothetical protein